MALMAECVLALGSAVSGQLADGRRGAGLLRVTG